MNEKIQKAGKLMWDNRKCYKSEVSKLQKHYDEIVAKLKVIKKNIEIKMRGDLERKNAEPSKKKIYLEKKPEKGHGFSSIP